MRPAGGARCAARSTARRWRGRNHDASQPRAVVRVLAAGAQDTGLDPVSVLSVPLHIAAGGKARLTFATAAHVDPATLHAVIDKHRQASGVQRASLMSATLAAVRARDLHLGAESLAAVQTLSTALMLSVDTQDPGTATDLPGVVDRRLLWRFGLSGDRPLLVVSVGALQGLPMLRTLAQALRLWAWAGVACDLVLLDGEAASYAMAVQHALVALREAHDATRPALTRPDCTGLFVLRGADLSVDETATLQALARVAWFHADGRTLAQHVQAWTDRHEGARDTRQETSTTAVPVATTPEEPDRAQADFDVDSGDVHFEVGRLLRPVRPWINVLANPGFGSQVSEAGGGFTWAVNSRLHQLTAWSNDPVADPPCEWLLLQDLRTRQSWSLTPSAWGAGDTRYRVSQGQGRTAADQPPPRRPGRAGQLVRRPAAGDQAGACAGRQSRQRDTYPSPAGRGRVDAGRTTQRPPHRDDSPAPPATGRHGRWRRGTAQADGTAGHPARPGRRIRRSDGLPGRGRRRRPGRGLDLRPSRVFRRPRGWWYCRTTSANAAGRG
jgi:cyclic beta-1,2-glucan synthetase